MKSGFSVSAAGTALLAVNAPTVGQAACSTYPAAKPRKDRVRVLALNLPFGHGLFSQGCDSLPYQRHLEGFRNALLAGELRLVILTAAELTHYRAHSAGVGIGRSVLVGKPECCFRNDAIRKQLSRRPTDQHRKICFASWEAIRRSCSPT